MAGSTIPASGAEPEMTAGARIGNVRWTICAMLFVATSINYMDRQVVSILKPTLEHSIGMTEVGYSYIVDAFTIAYAVGLVAAGRFVDKVGTRIATWSSWLSGASLPWATRLHPPCLNLALLASL